MSIRRGIDAVDEFFEPTRKAAEKVFFGSDDADEDDPLELNECDAYDFESAEYQDDTQEEE